MKKIIQKGLVAVLALTITLSFTVYPHISSAAANSTYTVKYGDTLWKIAQKHKVSLPKLIAANSQLHNPNVVYPYQTIYIPAAPTGTTTAPSAPSTSKPSTSAPTTAVDNSISAWETKVVQLVNVERANAGLKPLTQDSSLANVARAKSADMRDNNYFSHQSPTYGSPFDMMKQFGISYGYAGENIAAGQQSPQAVVDAWMNSEGHRANILSANFTKIGVGLVKGGSYQYYWTQMFTG